MLNEPEASVARLEGGKARLLFEALSGNDADLTGLPSELANQIREARGRVRVLEAELRASEEEMRSIGRGAVPRAGHPPAAWETIKGFGL